MSKPPVGIIGGGMAGLSCAVQLAQHGFASRIFDKGRGPGGRMATRRVAVGEREVQFDHGAQYFTARDPAFVAVCSAWQADGVVAPWPAAGTGAMVGTPGMNAPLKQMAHGVDVLWAQQIDHITLENGLWRVQGADMTEYFERLVVAVPAEQAAQLLASAAPALADEASRAVSDPCWAVMAVFAAPLPVSGDTIRGAGAKVSWAARNGAKPGRAAAESWVIHASPDYSRAILEQTAEEAGAQILAQFFVQAGIAPARPVHLAAHRWRYAMAAPASGPSARWDAGLQIGVAGDWLVSPRVEGAFLSGRALAEMIAADDGR